MGPMRRTILHVDDDRLMLTIVRQRLEAEGFEVVSLDDPRQAIPTLLDRNCRVVLLDVQMPHINGLELLSQIKKYDGGVQVIMLTGLVSMNTVLESLRRGAEACLFKPVLDFDPLHEALTATFVKLEHWWTTLAELNRRRLQEREVSTL
jgi:DNA-binding NtrC family response regulator